MASLVLLLVQWTRTALKKLFPHSRSVFLVDRSPYGVPVPTIKHKILTENEIRDKKLVIVGDVHGCYEELVLLVQKCQGRDPDTLILFVGDLINKGPGNLQVLRLVRELGALSVRGNHDEVCLREWQNSRNAAQSLPGSFKWMNHLSTEELDWLSELPYSISIPSRNIMVVHAGLVPKIPIEEQSLDNLLHIRDLKYNSYSGEWMASKEIEVDGEPWASKWPGPSHVYFGHDARRFYQSYQFATGLDTGCVYGGKLTAVYPCEGGRLVEVKAIGVPRDRPPLEPISQ